MDRFTTLLEQISKGVSLTSSEASFALEEIISGKTDPVKIAAFLFGMRCKGETVEELTGFVLAMRNAAIRVDVDVTHAIDLCGTGGDGTGTFNISTAAMFIAAGAGVPVLKHGNTGISSRCGSYDVLKMTGAEPALEKEKVEKCFRETGMAFMFAPLYHPAMAHIMPVRKKLGLHTFFNILGPLLNPAGVKRQVTGAFNRDMAKKIIRIMANLDTTFAYTVHSEEGLDEFSTTGDNHLFTWFQNKLKENEIINGRIFGLDRVALKDLKGGSAEENAHLIQQLFEGNGTKAQREVVLFNAAFAIHASGTTNDRRESFHKAEESLYSGKAKTALHRFVEATSDLSRTS